MVRTRTPHVELVRSRVPVRGGEHVGVHRVAGRVVRRVVQAREQDVARGGWLRVVQRRRRRGEHARVWRCACVTGGAHPESDLGSPHQDAGDLRVRVRHGVPVGLRPKLVVVGLPVQPHAHADAPCPVPHVMGWAEL